MGAVEDVRYYAELMFNNLPAFNDAKEQHTEKTAERFAKALVEMTTPQDIEFTTFDATTQNMITLGPIPFYTLCAHHVLPFHGSAWVGYVPMGKIAGLSKFARAVKELSKGLHVQEELTEDIAQYLQDNLHPLGVAVVMKAEHLCMAMRGVQAAGVVTTTASMLGVFADHDKTAKAEFMEAIRA